MVITLREAITSTKLTNTVANAVSKFTCQDNDVETFLKTKAVDFESRNKSRTYLIFDDDVLVAYFTLSLNALSFRENVSKNTIKRIDGFSKDIKAAGIILIGQFGKDCILAKHTSGETLLNTCMETIYKAQEIIGGRFVMLECLNIEKVVSFYVKNGFEFLQYDKKDKYMQMIRRL